MFRGGRIVLNVLVFVDIVMFFVYGNKFSEFISYNVLIVVCLYIFILCVGI